MPILDPHSMEFISHNAEQTRRVGMRLGSILKDGDLICLIGDLGAGKTTFVQGIAAGWGSLDPASSPTFVIVNVYRRSDGTSQRLYHLDAYRLSSAAEAEDLDMDEMIEDGPVVVEWAERIQAALPDEYLWVRMRYVDEEQRDLLFTARGQRYQKMLAFIRRQLYGVV